MIEAPNKGKILTKNTPRVWHKQWHKENATSKYLVKSISCNEIRRTGYKDLREGFEFNHVSY